MNNYEIRSKKERFDIVIDIVKKLKNFNNGTYDINLYDDKYSFYKELNDVMKEYINGTNKNGIIHFVEINKYIEYYFPIFKNEEPLFVLRFK